MVVHRGAKARELREKWKDSIIPSRWLDKWKDCGDDFKIPVPPKLKEAFPKLTEDALIQYIVKLAGIRPDQGAKSRWIIQGFHDPDIHLLNRSVPTPEGRDVPLTLQFLASIKAKAAVADVSGAFAQGLRNQRDKPLFVSPPPGGGIPGEDQDVLVELKAEIYGLVSGPPGWRRSLLTTFKALGFSSHPLAPCVVTMYDGNRPVGAICIETDDLLLGGIGPKFHAAVEQLKKEYKFGEWKELQTETT